MTTKSKTTNITKEWDWNKNKDNKWLIPCTDSAYLAQRWSNNQLNKFLDLGCGLGRHSIYMANHGFDVTAVDLSQYGVNHLAKWSKRENLDIKTHVSNMLNLPFDDNSFDCVMAYNVIYHTDTNGFIAALNEIKRVLKPNGEIYLTSISKDTWSYRRIKHYTVIDDNTIVRNDDETEMDVPHFYVDVSDIKKFFNDWHFAIPPIEYCEYNMNEPQYYSKHWRLIVSPKGL